MERGDRERYTCPACGRAWLRIGFTFEPDEDRMPAAHVVSGGTELGGELVGPTTACCDAVYESAGWEKSRCTKCGKRYIRVGITFVPE